MTLLYSAIFFIRFLKAFFSAFYRNTFAICDLFSFIRHIFLIPYLQYFTLCWYVRFPLICSYTK